MNHKDSGGRARQAEGRASAKAQLEQSDHKKEQCTRKAQRGDRRHTDHVRLCRSLQVLNFKEMENH